MKNLAWFLLLLAFAVHADYRSSRIDIWEILKANPQTVEAIIAKTDPNSPNYVGLKESEDHVGTTY